MTNRKRCHCNDSSGTDCYWCGGSSWKQKRLRTNTPTNSKQSTIAPNKESSKYHRVFIFPQHILGSIPKDIDKRHCIKAKESIILCKKELQKIYHKIIQKIPFATDVELYSLCMRIKEIENSISKVEERQYHQLKIYRDKVIHYCYRNNIFRLQRFPI